MGFTQWSTPDGEAFFPAGQVVKRLPPDYYKIEQTMNGIFLLKNPIKTEELVAFPDSASDKVINEIQRFWRLENKFREAQIPFKRGILMYGPPGSGKCVVKDTLIATSIGIMSIEELFRVWKNNKSMMILSEDGPRKVQAVIDDGEKNSYKITFSNGVQIEGSEKHRVRILTNDLTIQWRSFSEIKIGESVICVGCSAPLPENKLEDGLAYFSGLITGDGGISVDKNGKRNRFFFVVNSNDLENEVEYINTVESCFVKFLGKFNGWVKSGENAFATNRTYDVFAEKMISEGFFDFDKINFRIPKRIPKYILKSSVYDIMQFLSALADTDGYISSDKNCIEWTLNSEGLARDIQNVCSAIGIRTDLSSKFIKDISLGDGTRHNINSYYWRLRIISNQSFMKMKTAGFNPKISYKRNEFEKLCIKPISTNVRTIIPFTQDGKLVKGIYDRLMSLDKHPGSRNTYSLFSSMSGKGVSIETLQKINQQFPNIINDNQTIKYILDNDCYFVTVENIEQSNGHMYDLTIDGPSPTYVINGIVSHNTCALRTVVEDLTKNQNGIVVDFCSPILLKEGYELVRKIHPDIPIIVMIEDLDAVLYRYNESEVLNLLDGMYGIDKTVFVATTNYPEKLGSRIMNRPSRFDKRIFIGMPTEAARQVYLNAKLKNLEESQKWAKDTDGFSIAHLKELFVAVKILGEGYIDALHTLQTMKDGPTSQSFDPYNTKTEYPCEVGMASGPAYCESKGIGSKGMINEDKYAQYGTGKLYKKMKEQMKSGIQKRTPNVSDIARIISEDIRHDNGFIK